MHLLNSDIETLTQRLVQKPVASQEMGEEKHLRALVSPSSQPDTNTIFLTFLPLTWEN